MNLTTAEIGNGISRSQSDSTLSECRDGKAQRATQSKTPESASRGSLRIGSRWAQQRNVKLQPDRADYDDTGQRQPQGPECGSELS